ncbi:MAG TPA: hypothetical protein VGD17_07755 [Chitinophagaceae bacterium]
MKRYLIYAVFIAAFVTSIVACKKESLPAEDILVKDSVEDIGPVADPVISSTGFLTGKVMPETKFSLTLYNDTLSYTEFEIVNRTGAFSMKNVKAGEYTLLIQPADPGLNSLELIKIAVDSGRTTNLGLIFLP